MAALSGTLVVSRIVPTDTDDTYATHDADYGRGGYRSVADLTERDAITEPRRKIGMKVFVNSENKEYQLISGITNSDWTEAISGGGLNPQTLTELTNVYDTDFMVMIRDNKTYKVSINTLKGIFGGETVDNTLLTEDGVYITTETGAYINYEVI